MTLTVECNKCRQQYIFTEDIVGDRYEFKESSCCKDWMRVISRMEVSDWQIGNKTEEMKKMSDDDFVTRREMTLYVKGLDVVVRSCVELFLKKGLILPDEFEEIGKKFNAVWDDDTYVKKSQES